MAIFVDCVCDFPHCNHIQPIHFEAMTECWYDAITALRDAGWQIEMKGARVIKSICPDHIE